MVIAIIAILAAIVMVNVVQYIQKSKVAAIEQQLDSLPTIAAGWYATNNNYSTICEDGFDKVLTGIQNTESDVSIHCYDNQNQGQDGVTPDMWLVDVAGPVNGYCIDSSGFKGKGDGSDYRCHDAGWPTP